MEQQPEFLMVDYDDRIFQTDNPRIRYRDVNRDTGRKLGGVFRVVEHDHWDHSQVRLSAFPARWANGVGTSHIYGRHVAYTDDGLGSALRRLSSRDAEILDEIDQLISKKREELAKLQVRRKSAITRAFNQGRKVTKKELPKPLATESDGYR